MSARLSPTSLPAAAMPPPKTVTPLEALDMLVRHVKKSAPVTMDVESAAGATLAEAVSSLPRGAAFPGDGPDVRRASHDGYAVAAGAVAGAELAVESPYDAAGDLLEGSPAAGTVRRVDCGARVPADLFAVVPVDATVLLGSGKVRLLRAPAQAEGLMGAAAASEAPSWPEGTPVDSRLQAFLLARGERRIAVHPPFRVGVLVVGDELTDLAAGAVGRSERGPERPDLGGGWLLRGVEARALEALPLGIVSDAPDEIGKAILRARDRRLDVLLMTGGTGRGVNDRTGEALHHWNTRIFFERLDVDLCPTLLYAKLGGMDVIGLSGRPLSMSIGFDLFVDAALSLRAGRFGESSDWRRRALPIVDAPPPEAGESCWRVLAARPLWRGAADGAGAAPPEMRVWQPETPFSPLVAGADGWAIVPPAARPSAPGNSAPWGYYQRCGGSAS